MPIATQDQVMMRVELQQLRARLLVHLNRSYPKRLDVATLYALEDGYGTKRILRELYYLLELQLVKLRKQKHWRISAMGRDFLIGLVEAKGIADSAMLHDIGE